MSHLNIVRVDGTFHNPPMPAFKAPSYPDDFDPIACASPASGEEVAPVRVLVVQDHLLLASALIEILEVEPGLSVSALARTGAEAVELATQETVGVVLIDYQLPDVTGAAVAAMIRTASPDTAIVFHTADDTEAAMLDAIDAGASAYLTRSATAEQIVEAVKRAARGEVLIPVSLFARAIARRRRHAAERRDREKVIAEFTPRELEVLRILAQGLDTPSIARQLGIAQHTVEWHLRHVIEKLQVHSKLQAVVAAVRQGIIEL
jgi:two-component system nitrate/nitrite response regulator NarL